MYSHGIYQVDILKTHILRFLRSKLPNEAPQLP